MIPVLILQQLVSEEARRNLQAGGRNEEQRERPAGYIRHAVGLASLSLLVAA